MLYDGHHWRCTWCGTILGPEPPANWHAELRGMSGHQNVRVVIADGREIHQCPPGADGYRPGGLVSGAPGFNG